MTVQAQTSNRRAMVEAIAGHLGQEQHYAGPPSFAYTIGAITVARDATITGEDAQLRMLLPFLAGQGYIDADEVATVMGEMPTAEQESAAEPDEGADDGEDADSGAGQASAPTPEPGPEEAATPAPDDYVVQLETGDFSPAALANLILMLHSKQYLLGRALGRQTIRIPESMVARVREAPPQSMEGMAQMVGEFRDTGELSGLDLRSDCMLLTFPIDDERPIYQKVTTRLVRAMAARSKQAKRIQPELAQPGPEAEKYCMNTWLLRLGYSGAEFKADRHFLMEKLSGYAAFKTNEGMDKHKAKLAAARRELRDLRSAVTGEAPEVENDAEENETGEGAGNDGE